jgi:uncharacterized membrane protein
MWWLFAVPALLVAGWSALQYWGPGTAGYFDEQLEVYLRMQPALLLHVVFGPLALALGPLQFVARIRARWPGLHRAIGRGYLASVLLAAVGGLLLAPHAFGRAATSVGFGVLGVLWLFAAWMALACIRRGDVAAHRRWVMRSYALTFAAVMLRVWLLGLAGLAGLRFESAYAIAAWACWIPNLMAAELLIRRWRI